MDKDKNKIIQRFADIQKLSYEEANKLIGADNDDQIMSNIANFTKNKIKNATNLNREQRRKLMKKVGKKNKDNINVISKTAEKLDYIDLIEKMRELNKKQEEEIKNNGSNNFTEEN